MLKVKYILIQYPINIKIRFNMFLKTSLFFLIITQILHAQSVKDCVTEVLETNPKVQERLKSYNVSAQNINIVQSEYWPKLDLKLGVGYENTDRYNNANPTEQGFKVYQHSLTYTQNLFKGFQTYHKIKEEEARVGASAYSFIETANDTAFDMVNTYLLMMKNIELLKTAQENIDINEKILKKVKKLYKSGLTTRSEVNKIESSLYLAKSDYVVQENNLIDAQYNLQRLLGRAINKDNMTRPDLNSTELPRSLESAIEFAMHNNPSLLVSQYNIKLAQAAWKEKQSNLYPAIDIEISQSMNKNISAVEGNENRFRAMAFLSYNFFHGFADEAHIQKNVSKIHQEIQLKNDLRRQVIQGLQLSYVSYTKIEDQLAELELYKDFSLQTLTLYAKEYDLGRRSLLDLLSAQNDLIGAKSQIIKARYSHLFSKYRILDAMGILVSTILDSTDSLYEKVNLSKKETQVQEDTLPVYLDTDEDKITANNDICSNTLSGAVYTLSGCASFKNNSSLITQNYGPIVFDDEVEMNDEGNATVEKLIVDLKELKTKIITITILGNVEKTDFSEKEALRVSQKRANFIEDLLIKAGVNQATITTVAQSGNAPLYTNESANGRDMNNRVDIIVQLNR